MVDLTSLKLKNSLNIDIETLGYLLESLQEFSNLDAELPVRLLRYLVDGEDEAAVAEMVDALEHQYAQQSQHGCQVVVQAAAGSQNVSLRRRRSGHYWPGPNSQSLITFLSKSSLSEPGFYCRLSCLWCSSRVNDYPKAMVVNISELSQQSFRSHLLRFLKIVLLRHHHRLESIPQTNLALTARIVDSMYVEFGEAAGSFVRDIYDIDPNDYYQIELATCGLWLKDFPYFTLEHSGIVKAALQHPQRERRIHAMNMLQRGKVLIDEFLDAISTSAVSSAKSERNIAADLLKTSPDSSIQALQTKAESGSSSERQQAVKLLWKLAGEASKPFLLTRLKTDKAAKVRAVIEQLIAPPKIETVSDAVLLPPLQPVEFQASLSENAREIVRELADHESNPDRISRLVELLENGTYEACKKHYAHTYYSSVKGFQGAIEKLLVLPEVELIQAVRLLVIFHRLTDKRSIYDQKLCDYEGHQLLLLYRNHHPDCGDLRQLAAVLETIGINPERIGEDVLAPWNYSCLLHWGEDTIWPYFAERPALLESALNPRFSHDWEAQYQSRERQKNGVKLLKRFSKVPANLVPILWQFALVGPKNERAIAQTCLNKFSDTPEGILKALSNSEREIRTTAAIWLCDRNDPAAIEPLKNALRKEKNETTKGIMLRSLEKLGASIDEFFNRAYLLEESQTLLKKGIPTGLDWFPFDAMPMVHWHDTGKAIDPDLIKGLVVKGFRQKTVEPGPIFRRYVELWRPADQTEFGQFVLEAWVAHDQACGSATKAKGVLAFASIGCGVDAVKPIQTYLNTWYGKRAVQCKILLQILSWINDDSAIQLLLAVANRFRTKGIQEAAENIVNQLAERRGWSRDQLADRTIPTVGFDQEAKQILDYGQRQFTLLLDTNMELVLRNADGKIIKSLPAARKTEDSEKVKTTKKQLSTLKKQLKEVLKLQRERLYEAMCTQRSWQFAEWDLYLNQHPIVGRYCQQLVWATYDESNTLLQTFRPLEDRTLTDAEDDEVTPDPTAVVRLAHSCHLSTDTIEGWRTHFADYDVVPLLQQFRPSGYVLPKDKQTSTKLNDFEGYLINAFQLRSLATKQNYIRGLIEDGGCFYSYNKRFSGLSIEAIIKFSGNYVPEENHTVALQELAFEKLPDKNDPPGYYHRPELPLGDIPTVLLNEVWQDLQTIASHGSGYDAEWEKKVWN